MPTCVSSLSHSLRFVHSVAVCFCLLVFVHQIVYFAHELAQNIIQSDSIIILPFLCWFFPPLKYSISLHCTVNLETVFHLFWSIFLFANIIVGFDSTEKKQEFDSTGKMHQWRQCLCTISNNIDHSTTTFTIRGLDFMACKKNYIEKKKTNEQIFSRYYMVVCNLHFRSNARIQYYLLVKSSFVIPFYRAKTSIQSIETSNSYPHSVYKIVFFSLSKLD